MKALGILAVVAIAGALAWLMFAGQGTAPEPVVEAPAATRSEAPAPPKEAQETDTETVEQLNKEAGDAVQELEQQTTEAFDAAKDRVNEAVQGAVNSVNDSVQSSTGAAKEAVSNALEKNEIPTETTTEFSEALTVEGFDAATLREAVESSDIGFAQSQAAKALIAQAEKNPAMIQEVVDQLKAILGPS